MKRLNLKQTLLPDRTGTDNPFRSSVWDAKWISPPHPCDEGVVLYTLDYITAEETVLHISAGERYILYLDGELAGRGPVKGTHTLWYYDSYSLPGGTHRLCALVYTQGQYRAWSQVSFGNRLIVQTDQFSDQLSTGFGPWKTAVDRRFGFHWSNSPYRPEERVGTSGRFVFDAGQPVEAGTDPAILENGYEYSGYDIRYGLPNLRPNPLPPMLERELDLNFSAEFDANSRFQKLIALDNYYCAYPVLEISGGRGARLSVSLSEGLYQNGRKGDRADVQGKEFRGIGDLYHPDGSRRQILTPLWWLAGRYLMIEGETADEPLTIHAAGIRETRYPIEWETPIPDAPPLFQELAPRLMRTLQMCMHETYMDCPHYEQLMYLGDTRLQLLITYAVSSDRRMPRHAIELLASGLNQTGGLLPCTYPVNNSRVIPGFCLYFVNILCDYTVHTGDLEFIHPHLPAARTILEQFLQNRTGPLVQTPDGWNFYDWRTDWPNGIPPQADGVSLELNAHLVYTLMLQAALERLYGEAEFASRDTRLALEIKDALMHYQTSFSEHTLCFLLLSGSLKDSEEGILLQSLLETDGETVSVYFSHYLFEVYQKYGFYDRMDRRLEQWRILLDEHLYTSPEEFTPSTRSDCHAWGAHPIYHYWKRAQNRLHKTQQ